MALFAVLYFVLFIFWLLLISRVIVEFIRSFARDWRPTGVVVVVLEVIFTITDPPVSAGDPPAISLWSRQGGARSTSKGVLHSERMQRNSHARPR